MSPTSVIEAGLAVLIWAQMLKLGFDRAKLLVVLSDGAAWIRSLCAWLPVKVFLILDLYHVKHKVWEMAAASSAKGRQKLGSGPKRNANGLRTGKPRM